MKIDYIATQISGTEATVTYAITTETENSYTVGAYRGTIKLSLMDMFQAMQKATATDPLAGFRVPVLDDFISKRQAEVDAAKAMRQTYAGTATSESASTSVSASTSTSQTA